MPRVTKYDEHDEPIAGYRLVSFLGAGQFGEVWKAVETNTGRYVAIKIIDLSHSNSALKELKALNLVKNLNHPHLIPIVTARLKDKNNREIPLHKTEEYKQKGALRELVIAMGLGDKSLSARLKEMNPDGTDSADFRGLPVDELIGYMLGAAKGIDFLNKADHGLGLNDGPIVHCDIKPDNMMIVAGEVQIVDCGVAVIITPDVRQTKAAGSPAYSAPELTGNKPVPGTDQYALAISYYELRTGHLPFDEQMGQLSIMLAHAEGRLDFGNPVVSEDEVRVLKWATAVRPKERYPTCLDMVKQLERCIEGLLPLEPSQIGVRSGVVQVPRSRKSVPPLDPSMLRSTPNLPAPPPEAFKEPDPVVSFDLPPVADDLRGTVIPNSDRYFQPNESGLSLPTPPARDAQSTANFGPSQAEIVMPADDGDPLLDDDLPEPDRPTATPYPDKRPPNWSADISRPQIAMDGDDPMGARAGTIELDPEIANIIKGSAARIPAIPPAPAIPAPRPQSRAEVAPVKVPGKRSTQFPRETPAEEEAKTLPPWAKDEKSLPPWAKEAKEAEKQKNRSTVHPAIPATNWKETDTAKPGGGLGVKLIVGGVLVGGLAAGGAYFSGLLGGKGPDLSSKGVDSQTGQQVQEIKPVPNTEPKPGKVDSVLIQAIEDLLAAKPNADFVAVQEKIDQLPNDKQYDPDRERLTKRLGELRVASETALDKSVADIDALVKSINAKPDADPVAEGKKITEAERLIKALPNALPAKYADKRTAWSGEIGKLQIAMAGTAGEREFVAALVDLESRSKETFNAQAKKVYDRYTLAGQQKKIGAKLVAIGDKKPDYRETVTAFLTEIPDRFLLLLPAEPDREPVFQWRVAALKIHTDKLRTKLGELAAVPPTKKTVEEINALYMEIRDKKKDVGTPFGEYWNDKYLGDEIPKLLNLTMLWSEAGSGRGEGIRPFRELLRKPSPPDLAFAMAAEYQRIGVEKRETVANLRAARDAARLWPNLADAEKARIDALFQAGLAIHVRNDLTAAKGKPDDWAEILKTCGTDGALGWARAVEAEQRLETGGKAGDLSDAAADVADETHPDRKAFVAYLKAASAGGATAADELLNLYKSAPPILNDAPFRKKRAAGVLASAAIVAPAALRKPEEIIDGSRNPYEANAKSLPWLKRADELDGRDHPEWAVHLYLLAAASADADAARVAVKKIAAEDGKIAKVADLPFAMAYHRLRAADQTLDGASRVAAYAATARLAYRLMEATFEPNGDAKAREEALLPRIAAFAKEGLDIPAGYSSDRLSLQLALVRRDLLATTVFNQDWLKRTVPEIEKIARDLPEGHPDVADARAYRSFATLMRFSNTYGDLNAAKAEEPARLRAWGDLIADAEAALKLDPENGYANRALGMALIGTFREYIPVYVPPEGRKTADFVRDRERTLKADRHLKLATDALKTRPLPALWRMRAVFLFQAANEFAKAGEPAEDVRRMLRDAAAGAQKSDAQRTDKLIDDPLLLGRIQEDLAWLAQDRPAENYGAAIRSLTLAANRPQKTPDQRLQNIRGRMDLARTVVRAVQFGHFPAGRLADADAALADMKSDIASLPEAERETAGVKVELAKAAYWKALRQLADGKFEDAEKSLADAAEALAPYAADMHAFSFVHRAEAALAGNGNRDSTATAVRESATKVKALVDADTDGAIRRTLAFAPDYLLARNALAERDAVAAEKHFAAAFAKIEKAWSGKTLIVEDSFALRCLSLELQNVKLNGIERPRREKLLADLESAFGWSLTPADRKLVAAAIKK